MDWREGHLINISEKENLGKRENHRGITLLSVPGEVSNSVAELDERISRCPASTS
ncbi:unnamed protein product [Schistosoma mattheei]|uniref:Uncharacterized protein n=1 Tax=Schistosoma mattheei TaxID=31246 RepID=A0AA85BI52_9TREM|nr:unnamed protein product [Schistosoma mattheei]